MEHLKDYFQSAPAQITNPDIILNAAFKIEKVCLLSSQRDRHLTI
jgi:hypothetical protein